MNTIVKMKFGSHLYGTNTKDSDTDYKGIFMPTKEQILLGRIPKCYSENTKVGVGRNTSEDIDIETYSLHYFLELACQGQTVAIDMLHAPNNMILETSDVWKAIQLNRHLFITKDMNTFVGYAMRQASKYGIKGSRLASALKVIDFINDFDMEGMALERVRVRQVWDKLPEGEHIHKYETGQLNNIKIYQVCGKKIQETATLRYLYDIIIRFYNAYGARARKAEKNEGIDWKAVSHAIRASMQLKELYTTGKIIFPLKHAKYLKDVKAGKLDYKTDVSPYLEASIAEVGNLAVASDYPKKVNRKYWERFIIKEVGLSLEEKSWIII
ncbi:nucleotidyltransferase domain-containing protein [candidate division WOR-3 bacterium]|nr:nucleotidyltransferase domain-containing protein [candidate division WOR-3 bacterium]